MSYTKNLGNYATALEKASIRLHAYTVSGLKKGNRLLCTDKPRVDNLLKEVEKCHSDCLSYVGIIRENIDMIEQYVSVFPIEEVEKLIEIGVPKAEICRRYGITFPTLQRHLGLAEAVSASREMGKD